MSFVENIEIPEKLKGKVVSRLKKSSALQKHTHKVKVAMSATRTEIKGLRSDSKTLERNERCRAGEVQ
jgi:ribosome-associated translation inhibitor RaiA